MTSIHGRWHDDETFLIQCAVNIANCVAASEKPRVILLENHDMRPVSYLLQDGPRQILEEGGFLNALYEVNPEELKSLNPSLVGTYSEGPTAERGNLIDSYVLGKKGKIKFHAICDQVTSYAEAWAYIKKSPDYDFFKSLLMRPALKRAKTSNEAVVFGRVVDWFCRKHGMGIPFNHEVGVCLTAPVSQNLIRGLEKKSMDRATIIMETVKQLDMALEKFIYFRMHGQSDKQAASMAVQKLLPTDKAVFVYGAIHGWLANNPASFVDQLQTLAAESGHSASACEVILLVEKRFAKDIHRRLTKLENEGKLRTSLNVFDYEQNVKMPATEWLAKAGTMYPHAAIQAPSPVL